MPVSNQLPDGLADELRRIYSEAEVRLIEKIARALAQGINAPEWAEVKLAQIQWLQAALARDLNTLSGRSAKEIARAIVLAFNRGGAAAYGDIMALLKQAIAGPSAVTSPVVAALITETVGLVAGNAHAAILRTSMDAYRSVIRDAEAQLALGVHTRVEATQRALYDFAARGITGFTDRAGRSWDMASYSEMALRSANARASVAGHVETLQANGHQLVIVSTAPRPCPLCHEWEGKVLALADGTNVASFDGVQVAGTLEQAKADGFMHPNCRHTIGIYLPGITRPPEHNTYDPAGYEADQRQRAIERKIREWKRRKAAALTEEEQRKAAAKVREWQAEASRHADETGTVRRPKREQVLTPKP